MASLPPEEREVVEALMNELDAHLVEDAVYVEEQTSIFGIADAA